MSTTNPPHVNFIKANLVLNYLAKDTDLSQALGPDDVVINKKSTNEDFLFPQEVITVLTHMGEKGIDPTKVTKDSILTIAREVLLGVAPAPEAEAPAVEAEAAIEEVEATPPPPPRPAPRPAPRTRPAPAAVIPATAPIAPVAPAPVAPAPVVAPAVAPAPVAVVPVSTPPRTRTARPAPVAPVAAPVALEVQRIPETVEADSKENASAQSVADQQLTNSASTVIFQLLAGAQHFALRFDTAPGFEARREKFKALYTEYGTFIK